MQIHPPREKCALIARYKYMLMYLRKNNARERQNYIATGGGPRPVFNEKIPFDITGPIIELSNLLGVSITGLDGFGSDVTLLPTDEGNIQSKDSSPNIDGTQPLVSTIVDSPSVIDENDQEYWDSLMNTDTSKEADADSIKLMVASSGIDDQKKNTNEKIVPGRSQFFPTSSQRRPAKRKNAGNALCTSDMLESRKAYIDERERRASEKHAAEMHYEKAVMEAKLEEMKAERESRAKILEMTMRHKEGIFARQCELLDAARNALLSSSSKVALDAILSLALNQTETDNIQ